MILGLFGFAASVAALTLGIRILVVGNNAVVRVIMIATTCLVVAASFSVLLGPGS